MSCPHTRMINSGPISTVVALTKLLLHLETNIQQVQRVVGYMETTCLAKLPRGKNGCRAGNKWRCEFWAMEVRYGTVQHRWLVDLLRLWGLPLQYLHEFSREPALATLARPALPPLGLDLDPWVDLQARVRIQLSHHRHDLVLLQAEFGRRRRLERINRARKRELRRVERREDDLLLVSSPSSPLVVLLLLLQEKFLLFLLLLRRAIGENFYEFVHRVGQAQERDEEKYKRLFARVGRRRGFWRSRGGGTTLYEGRTAVEKVAELAAQFRAVHGGCCCCCCCCCSVVVAAGEDVAEPADEAEEAEDAAEGVAELGELVDDAGEGEEGRVGGHEGRFEHLREAGERLHDRVEEREGRRGRRLERLRHARVRRVERHAHAHAHAPRLPAERAAHPAERRGAWVHPVHVHVHAVRAVAVPAVPAERRAHPAVERGIVGRGEGVCAAEAVVRDCEGGGEGGGGQGGWWGGE